MKKFVLFLFVAIILVGSLSCSNNITLEDLEKVTYCHPHGSYSVIVPKDWEKKLENKISVGFVGNEPAVAFNIVYEIGGYDYFSMDHLAEETVLFLGKKIKDLKIVSKSPKDDGSGVYQFVAQGVLPGEQEVLLKGIILEPEMGIRYYLLFTSGIKDFDALDGLFNEIAGTFKMSKSGKELYQQLIGREKEQNQNQEKEEPNEESLDRNK